MQNVAFAGADRLVSMLDAAVSQPTPQAITEQVKAGLESLIRDEALSLPEELTRPCAESYARHLAYKSDEHGYTVVAMVWGPGQGTPVHDHAGVWCVEGVVDGTIEVQQYRLLERNGERFRFTPEGTVTAGCGSAGSLIPPFEYHTIANALPDRPSITLHVYGAELEDCGVFQPAGSDGWFQRQSKTLCYSE